VLAREGESLLQMLCCSLLTEIRTTVTGLTQFLQLFTELTQGHPADVVATQYLFYTTCGMSQVLLLVQMAHNRKVVLISTTFQVQNNRKAVLISTTFQVQNNRETSYSILVYLLHLHARQFFHKHPSKITTQCLQLQQ
jgi:hypothetical protein